MKIMKNIRYTLVLFLGIMSAIAQTQGTLDTSFLPDNDGKKGANRNINAAVEQADGKIILGGWFENYNGVNKNRLVRINPDGSMDDSFNQVSIISTGNAGVESLAIQADGKILVGGKIKINDPNNGNTILEHLMRLNPDGTFDGSFAAGIPISGSPFYYTCGNGEIYSISVQNDGKIIIAGDITFCAGSTIDDNENILRLNTDGTIDTSFMAELTETGLPGSAEVYKTIIQPDGKILASGYFNESNGVSSAYITRLNTDGSNDPNFVVGTGFNDDVNDMILQPDGKIVVVGDFTDYNGTAVNNIVRLNDDGTIDSSFNVPVGAQNEFSPGSASSADLESVSLQPDGKLVVSGGFNLFDGVQISQVARLNPDGSLDTTYNNSVGKPSFPSLNTNILSDGSLLLTGAFTEYQYFKRDNILKITPSGDLDFTFNQRFGPSITLNNTIRVNDIKPHSSGYYVGGQFDEYSDQLSNNIAKINADGSLDTSFSTGTDDDNGFEDEVMCLAVQQDDKVIVGGDFNEYNGTSVNRIARLNPDGSLDNTFITGSGFNSVVECTFIQPDGKILVGGNFLSYNGSSVNRLIRLNTDGSLDTSFNSNISFRVYAVAMDQNGFIYAGLSYSNFVGSNTNAVVRLNADGSIDPSFDFTVVGVFSNAKVNDITFDDSSNIYITGRFIELGTGKNFSTYKLYFSGNPYIPFDSPETPNEGFDIAVQSDGKIIVGGDIEEVELPAGTIRDIRGVFRLNADGTLDDTFNPDNANVPEGIDIETNFIGDVNALHLDNDGRLIVGGEFGSYNGERKLPLIAVSAFNDVPEAVLIPDPDFEQALIDLGIDSDNIVNGQILESEALATVDLDVSSKNISDLTGIDAFINLQTLNVSNNNLTELDLTQNLSLTSVVCNDNQLQSVDIKNSNNTSITNFNALNNPNLTCIQVDDIAFSNANWTDIDPQSFFTPDCNDLINIPDPNFEQALIDNGTDTDGIINGLMFKGNATAKLFLFVGNYGITDLTGIEHFTSLITIYAYENNLTTVDLNANTQLENLWLYDNNLTAIDLSSLPNLDDLDLSINQISSIDVSANSLLEEVNLSANNLSAFDPTGLPNLVELEISQNNLTILDLSQNPNLTRLRAPINMLEELDIKNGNNSQISSNDFNVSQNPELECINVDDVNYSNTNWTFIDPQMFFSIDCSQPIFFNIPDPNFEQALIDLNLDSDGVVNGLMDEDDAENVLSLDVSSKNISDLTGIEFFEDLQVLNAFDNNLTSVDLSQNDELSNLVLSVNNLSTLDLFGLDNLVSVNVINNALTSLLLPNSSSLITILANNNNLGSLNITDNPNLKTLQLNNNNLFAITYSSNNAALEILEVNFNGLNSSDLSSIADLVALEELKINNNQIVNLDLSQNTNLNSLFCSSNGLQSLNVQNGNNTNFTDFAAINNPQLTCIQVDDVTYSDANWTSVDNQVIFSLDCSVPQVISIPDSGFEQALIDNNIDSDGVINGQILQGDTFGVTTIWASNYGIADIAGLEFFYDLTDLDLSNNSISAIDLSEFILLENLNVGGNSISALDTSANTSLIHLNASANQISSMDVSLNTALENLDLSNNSITNLDLSLNTSLIDLNVSNNQITTVTQLLVASLENLDVSGNLINFLDLSTSPNLINVVASNNQFTVYDFSASLLIERLILDNNNLQNFNVSFLPQLTELNVSNNFILDLDLSQNPNLTTIICDSNNNLLSSINIQNGNNTNLISFQAQNNPNLGCILVDDPAFSVNNWLNNQPQFNFDSQSFFNINCSDLVPIQDPNFEQALIDDGIDSDLTVNGLMSLSNATGVTSILANSYNISSLQGIEYFTDLTDLWLPNNSITSVSLDQNTQLEFLNLFQNQLSSIDLSNNPNLISFELGNNLITDIDLSNNTSLSSFYLYGNLLSSIDISMLINLSFIDVSDNELTQLDLNQNPALNTVFASGNNLVNMYLQNGTNTLIDDSDFDVTNNPNLTCIEVDDVNYSFANWFNKDPQTGYGLDCEPDNDDCIDAPLLAYNVPTPGTTFSSTPSGLDPSCQQSGITIFDVWYKLDGPASGIISISINGGGLLKVAVYDDCLAALPIACGVDGILVDNLVPGDDYYIQVWVDAGSSGILPQNDNAFVGDFTIEITEETMANADFDNGLDFSFYPNPAKDRIFINAPEGIQNIQILDINGRVVLSDKAFNSTEKQIDVSQLSQGTYLLKVYSENATSTQKLIIN